MLCVYFVVVKCKGRAKYLFVAVVSYASMSSFSNNSSCFNPSHPRILPSHHTHLTTLTLSSGKEDSLSQLALAPNRQNPTNPGGEEERTPLSSQVKR